VLRVRSVTPSIDTLVVRMVRGQDLQTWTDHTPALADALHAERVAVSRRRPGVLTIIVERRNPFPHPLDATVIPESSAEVDLSQLDVGDNEYGGPFFVNLRGKRLLVVGASGAGKSSLLWNPLRAAGPMIRDGLLRVWMIDLKGGTETERGQALFHRWATSLDDAIDLLTDFRDSMLARQAWMRAEKVRRCDITADTPYELLMIDELAMLTAYGDRSSVRDALRLLAEVLTQGRAADHGVAGYVQEPTKDVVDVRELFDTRICLGVTAASHVDMALGDGARDRGALADETPATPTTPASGSSSTPAPASRSGSGPAGSPTPTSTTSPTAAHPTPGRVLISRTGRSSPSRALATPALTSRTRHEHRSRPAPRHDRRCRPRRHRRAPGRGRPAQCGARRDRSPRARRCGAGIRRGAHRRHSMGDAPGAEAPRGRRRRSRRGRLAGGTRAPPRRPNRRRDHEPDRARPGGGGVMWAVTGWVIATWLRVTLALSAAVVVSWLALGEHSGAFWLICAGAGLAELYLSRQLLCEWAHEARLGCWWWHR
jgi:hypothetical protein